MLVPVGLFQLGVFHDYLIKIALLSLQSKKNGGRIVSVVMVRVLL